MLSPFVSAVTFAIVKGPKSVAFDKQRMKNFLVPCIGRLTFDRWVVVAVYVGLLERASGGGDNTKPKKMVT